MIHNFNQTTTLRLDPETKGALRVIARQQGKTTHGLMISVLRAYAETQGQNKSPTAA